MAKLSIESAPSPQVPLRFFLTAPAWGVIAGMLLAVDGDQLLLSRWAPATLALVHALTLGVLGNAMMGSLLQFLPAAAGVHVRGGTKDAYALHALLNGGTVALVCGFRFDGPMLLHAAAALLTGAFALLAAITLPGLLRANVQRLLTIGIALAIVSGATAAILGAGMALGLAGSTHWQLPVLPWADVHAAWGVLGWVVVLLAFVAQVVMPMFQGTVATRPAVQAGWLVLVAGGLIAGSFVASRGSSELLRWVGAAGLASFAGEALWRQMRGRRSADEGLVLAWRVGLAVLVAAALVLLAEGPAVVLGTLVLAVALPLLVVGMQLEIVAFLGWIGLRRRVPRGTRIPGVQHLLDARHKHRALAGFHLAGVSLAVAALWPVPLVARVAGVALMTAHVLLWLTLARVDRHCRHFLQTTEAHA